MQNSINEHKHELHVWLYVNSKNVYLTKLSKTLKYSTVPEEINIKYSEMK